MKKLALIFCIAFLVPQSAAFAHQEVHVHSQWIKQQLSQLQRTVQQLQTRVQQLEGSGGQAVVGMQLKETCGPNQQKLCSKSCSAGSKIKNATCIGRGNIGKTYHSDEGVTCYCFNENDPNCRVEAVSASCAR